MFPTFTALIINQKSYKRILAICESFISKPMITFGEESPVNSLKHLRKKQLHVCLQKYLSDEPAVVKSLV